MKKVVLLTLASIAIATLSVSAADLTVPKLELITRGYIEGGSFLLGTRGSIDFLVAGGYKFGGRVLLGFESDDLDAPEDPTDLTTYRYLGLKGAHVIMRNPLGLPFDLTYFTGEYDTFATGDIFPTVFGSKSISTRFRGFLYFPEDDQVRYDGIHTISGTGFKLSTEFASNYNTSALYLYQDSYLGSGIYSLDIHTAFNTELFKMEGFLGATYPDPDPVSTYGTYRAGLLLFYDTGQGGEFLTQIGVTSWDPLEEFNINRFFFLFEPRVRFGFFSIILTLFWHPEYYLHSPTGESGNIDINTNFQLGNPDASITSGGVEAKLSLSSTATDQFGAVVSPYFSTITSGVIWDFKVNARAFPLPTGSILDIFEVFIGIRAEY